MRDVASGLPQVPQFAMAIARAETTEPPHIVLAHPFRKAETHMAFRWECRYKAADLRGLVNIRTLGTPGCGLLPPGRAEGRLVLAFVCPIKKGRTSVTDRQRWR
jgi:hypothetical protein